jgi:hypothetical protein
LSLASVSFFFSLPPIKKHNLVIFVFVISIQSLFLWFLIFIHWPYYTSFICFQFSHSILICHVLFFPFKFLFFWFLNFFYGLFVKFLSVFNFILQSKFMVHCFFSIWSSFFWFFFFLLKFFSFQFNPPMKNFGFPLIYFLFWF